MTAVHPRILPRLALDAANCLQLAYPDLDHDRRVGTRDAIIALLHTDVTDVAIAISLLRDVATHMRDIETRLDDVGRPFAMRKVRDVRQRVERLSAA